jgi:glutathionylspermidine synthase
MSHVRRRTIFDFCKWDPQCEDVDVLCPYALLLDVSEWHEIAKAARDLAAEVMTAEEDVLAQPRLLDLLGLPRSLRRLLAHHHRHPVLSGPRVIRFDFHATTEGWRISEANTDVPGGFIEASGFAQLMSQQFASATICGDPASRYAAALTSDLPVSATIALVHATAYTDDRQVMVFLARRLSERGANPVLVSPAELNWTDGKASALVGNSRVPVDRIVRFFPAEWLPQLRGSGGWQHFFSGSKTSQSNPGSAIVTQSKRFPLVWQNLTGDLTAWRCLLPETRDPRSAPWHRDKNWVLKPALGRVGDGIGLNGVTTQLEMRRIARSASWSPTSWVAQRRFEALPIATPDGTQFPVIGVFTIDGEPAGVYGRIAERPLIDHRARDIAVLLSAAAPLAQHGMEHSDDESRASV